MKYLQKRQNYVFVTKNATNYAYYSYLPEIRDKFVFVSAQRTILNGTSCVGKAPVVTGVH